MNVMNDRRYPRTSFGTVRLDHEIVRSGDFALSLAPNDDMLLELHAGRAGDRAAGLSIWSRRFANERDRDAVLARIADRRLDLLFLARLSMVFGSGDLDAVMDDLVADSRAKREAEMAEEAMRAQDELVVDLYRREGKHGRHLLELQRKSRAHADWAIKYDRAAERDRLCDWLRWQKDRFLEFLDYAAEHGDEALAQRLTDEMFETERRVKKEGRGAGGLRPLRMWRGS